MFNITHHTGCVSTNTMQTSSAALGDQEMEALLCTKYSRVAVSIHTTNRSSSNVVSLVAGILKSSLYMYACSMIT